MAAWADVQGLGYTVEEAFPGVNCVSGNGIQVYVPVDDQAQIDSLANPVLYAARIAPPPVLDLAATQTPLVAPLDPQTATLAEVVDAVNVLSQT